MRQVDTVFPSLARTASANSADCELPEDATGALFILSISAASGTTPTLDRKLQHKDPVSGVYVDIPGAAFAQKTGVANDSLAVYPGITAAANRAVNGVLSRSYRAVATIGGTTPSFTFTLAAEPLR